MKVRLTESLIQIAGGNPSAGSEYDAEPVETVVGLRLRLLRDGVVVVPFVEPGLVETVECD